MVFCLRKHNTVNTGLFMQNYSSDMSAMDKNAHPHTGGMTILPSKQCQTITGEVMTQENESSRQQTICLPKSNSSVKALTALAVSHYGTKATALMSVQKGPVGNTATDTSGPLKQPLPTIKWLSRAAVPSATVTSNTQLKEDNTAKEVTNVVHTQQDGQGSALATVAAVQDGSLAASQPSTCGAPLSNKGTESLQVLPEFQQGKVNAKLFPPSHYDLCKVEIGSWKHESSINHILSLSRGKLKAIFTRRKFIYEFEMSKDGLGTALMGFVQMACIEVPFTSVTGINIAPSQQLCEVLIEVNQPPSMFLGRKNIWAPSGNPAERAAKFDLNTPVDLTDGQLKTCPYHKITVRRCQLEKKLSKFDARFAALLRIPIKEVPNKLLVSSQKPSALPKKRPAPPEPKPLKAPKKQKAQDGPRTCKCTSGCTSNRCACAKAAGKCSPDCACMMCKNPFNILADLGVDVQAAKEDKCLMQNVFQISDLRSMLREKQLELPCCDITVPLSNCCLGVYQCPECDEEYSYSWCWGDLCDEENRPRNHCEICKRCGDHRDEHCFNCNKCYFAGHSGLPCPCEERGRGRLFGGFRFPFGSLF